MKWQTWEQRGYRPLKTAANLMERQLDALHDSNWPLVVAVTHDINVAAFLAARGIVDSFADETWPSYLDAAVMVNFHAVQAFALDNLQQTRDIEI